MTSKPNHPRVQYFATDTVIGKMEKSAHLLTQLDALTEWHEDLGGRIAIAQLQFEYGHLQQHEMEELLREAAELRNIRHAVIKGKR